MADKMMKISKKEYNDLQHDALLLEALYSFGIEDWEFFDDALQTCAGTFMKDSQYEETTPMEAE